MSNPEVTWVVLEGDGLAVCLRCGDRTRLARLPMTLDDFVKQLRAVAAMHAGCEPRPECGCGRFVSHCPECHGDGMSIAEIDGSTGSVICPRCGGSGG